MIIDMHSHLGDILYPHGGDLIFKKGIKKKITFDLITLVEMNLYRINPSFQRALQALHFLVQMGTKSCHARNATATLENNRRSMNEFHVEKTVCMPIAPHVTFSDLYKARQADPGIIPFTSVDFSKKHDFTAELRSDVKNGARGLKLHPIIQKESLASERTFAVVEEFALYKRPILFHSGVQSYYLGTEEYSKQNPNYGELHYAKELVSAFPQVTFIAGHAGFFKFNEAIELFCHLKNVHVEISFQAPENIIILIKNFGAERVLFGSDWPWGERKAAISSVKKACKHDKELEKLLFYENSARLIGPL